MSLGFQYIKAKFTEGRHIVGDTNPHLINLYQGIQDGTITEFNMRAYLEHESRLLESAALNGYAPIVSGIMSTIHAYTGDQMILDGPQRKGDLRRSRAGAQNIVPNSTGAAKAIGLVIPELNGKLIGSAQRVPTPTGSTTILVAVVKGKDVTKEGINAAMKAAGTESFGYTEDEIVSSDIIGMKFGSLFDATQTMVSKIDDDTYQVQVVSWYDNENSYTSQMVRTIKYLAELK